MRHTEGRTDEEIKEIVAKFKEDVTTHFKVKVDFTQAFNHLCEKRLINFLEIKLGHLNNVDFFRIGKYLIK